MVGIVFYVSVCHDYDESLAIGGEISDIEPRTAGKVPRVPQPPHLDCIRDSNCSLILRGFSLLTS